MCLDHKKISKGKRKIYNTLIFSAFLYGSKILTIKSRDAKTIRAAEMKYMKNSRINLDRL
jgi:hypothetical protein